MTDKEQELKKYSNPPTVYRKARKEYGRDVKIKISTRKDKKYMIFDPTKEKWIHFGQMNYEDYTKHKDEERRHKFLVRNHKWASADEYSPAYLAYTLLW